jgi:hypothetical protein
MRIALAAEKHTQQEKHQPTDSISPGAANQYSPCRWEIRTIEREQHDLSRLERRHLPRLARNKRAVVLLSRRH